MRHNAKQVEVCIKDFSKGINLDKAENVCDFDYAVECYNFNFKNGALVSGAGVELLTIPKSLEYGCEERNLVELDDNSAYSNAWEFKHYAIGFKMINDFLMFKKEDGNVYLTNLYGTYGAILPLGVKFTQDVNTFNLKMKKIDAILMQTSKDGIVTYNAESNPFKRDTIPNFVDLCYYKDKMFIVFEGEQKTLRISNDLEILNQVAELRAKEVEKEFSDERGRIEKLISFCGYLYLIREYGITKITCYEDSDQINISHVYTSGSKIYAKTVCDCGDKLVMLTRNGLFEMDGTTCKQIPTKLNEFLKQVKSDNVIASYRAGVYYLACRIDYRDAEKVGCELETNYVNNTLVAFNVNDYSYSISRGIDIKGLRTIQSHSFDKVIVWFNGTDSYKLGQITESGQRFNNSLKRTWCSPLSDLGYSNKTKCVNWVSLCSKNDCTLTIFTASDSQTIYIKGQNGVMRFPVNLKGEQIGIKIDSYSKENYISNLKLNIDLIEKSGMRYR